jgi:hypothetical protein
VDARFCIMPGLTSEGSQSSMDGEKLCKDAKIFGVMEDHHAANPLF